ncbi:MAG TPA: hypothetical protein VGK67_36245 [Myxococcales bacterium]|jgi:hypothetical protein
MTADVVAATAALVLGLGSGLLLVLVRRPGAPGSAAADAEVPASRSINIEDDEP